MSVREEAAERLAEREEAAAERRRERERLEQIAREERAKLAEAALARCSDASEIQRIKLELAKADQEAKAALAAKNLEAQQELERQTRLAREKIEEEAALAREELRAQREEERRAEQKAYAERRLEREAQAAARIEEARLAGDAKAAEQIAKELAAANRRSREALEASNRAAAEAESREEAAEQRLLRRAARAEARRLKEREAAMKRQLKYDEASKRRLQREQEDDALAERMRKRQEEAEMRRRLREEEAAARIAEAKKIRRREGGAAARGIEGRGRPRRGRKARHRGGTVADETRGARRGRARVARRAQRQLVATASASPTRLHHQSRRSRTRRATPRTARRHLTTNKDAMFGLMRAKGAVNRKLTRNRKTADAIGRAGASVFGAPPKVETKADMYRKRAQEERENVARWTPVAEPPRVQAPPVVVQTYVPEPVVVAPRIDVDWAAEVAKARDDAGSEEACRKSVATSDGDLGVSKHQQRRHQLSRRYASQRSRRPADARGLAGTTLTLANDPIVKRDPYTQQELPASTLAQPDFSWETRYGVHDESPGWAQALRTVLDKAREPRSISHLRSVFLPEKGLSSGGCSVYIMPLHIRLEGAVDDQPLFTIILVPLARARTYESGLAVVARDAAARGHQAAGPSVARRHCRRPADAAAAHAGVSSRRGTSQGAPDLSRKTGTTKTRAEDSTAHAQGEETVAPDVGL